MTLDTFHRWTKVSSDLFAVLSPDGKTLFVGWRRANDAQPVTCAVARTLRTVSPERWSRVLRAALRMSTIGRERAARAAALVMVREAGGVALRPEDREPHLRVW
jgi:hypothetical protein